MDRHRICLQGRLGRTVEYRQSSRYGPEARVTLGMSSHHHLPDGGRVVDLQWFLLIGRGRVAERMKKELVRGSRIVVYGRLQQLAYRDRESEWCFRTQVLVERFGFL